MEVSNLAVQQSRKALIASYFKSDKSRRRLAKDGLCVCVRVCLCVQYCVNTVHNLNKTILLPKAYSAIVTLAKGVLKFDNRKNQQIMIRKLYVTFDSKAKRSYIEIIYTVQAIRCLSLQDPVRFINCPLITDWLHVADGLQHLKSEEGLMRTSN